MNIRHSLLALTLMAGMAANAMPARQGTFVMKQPNGTEITVRLLGDEHRSMYLSEDGFLLLPDAEGNLYFATRSASGSLVASDVPAADEALRTDAQREFVATLSKDDIVEQFARVSSEYVRGLRSARAARATHHQIGSYPTTGEQKVLVILARFADVDFHNQDASTLISNMLNQQGYSDNGATGSVRDYFIDNSSGQYSPTMVVYGPVTLPQNMAYYGAPSDTGNDARPAEMIRDACTLLDSQIDFSEFDLDRDGYIDNVYLFYPGYSQADGANPNTIWPHASFAWSKVGAEYDGVKLDHYACSNEIDLLTSNLVSIGTFCHEFSHVLGLPDLYSTDYSNQAHPDNWSLMANGGRNNEGRTPPNFSVYERYALGWLEPETLSPSSRRVSLPDISENKGLILVNPANANELFLIENRQQSGWDSYLPGHGMLVWHIDYDEATWKGNKVNNDGTHQRIDLVEADGAYGAATLSGDAFPGASDIRAITPVSTPALRYWDGNSVGIGLYNILETSAGALEFNAISTSGSLPAVTALEPTQISPVSFVANWQPVPQADSYVLEVYSKSRVGSVVVKNYVPGYRIYVTGSETSAEIVGLDPATTYYYIVRAMGNSLIGDYSSEMQATTLDKDFRFFSPETLEPFDVASDEFTARWKAMDGAVEYFLSVYEVVNGEEHTNQNDFANNEITPEGWYASPACTISQFYGGNAKPALSLGGDYYIQSPYSEAEITSASFWCRALSSSWDDVNEIRLSGYYGNGTWTPIRTISPVSTDKAGTTFTLEASDFQLPVHSLRIELYRPYGSGTLIVDDISVTHTATTEAPLADYTSCSAGGELSMRVTGLKPSTHYRYEVTASNGQLLSAASLPRSVRTGTYAAISGVDDDALGARAWISGSSLIVCGGSQQLPLSVFTSSGMLVYSTQLAPQATLELPLPTRGIYILRIGTHSLKLIY